MAVEGVAADEGVVEALGGVGGEVPVYAGGSDSGNEFRDSVGSSGWPADQGTRSTG